MKLNLGWVEGEYNQEYNYIISYQKITEEFFDVLLLGTGQQS